MRKLYYTLYCSLFCLILTAQSSARKTYIETYRDLAVEEMKRTGIPASITLAQGILESGNGQSRLATKANNHFGIKCHGWTGKKIYHDDDEKNECFRKYNSAHSSFKDHSDFLTTRKRYASLFELKSNDYKGWAKGLKRAGYATAHDYDKRLIRIIEDERLYEYDTGYQPTASVPTTPTTPTSPTTSSVNNDFRINNTSIFSRIRYRNGVPYFVVEEGDTFLQIKKELKTSEAKIRRYNEMKNSESLTPGQPIYLKKKKKKAPKKYSYHVAKDTDTLHKIAQRYGIRLSKLEEYNGVNRKDALYEGQRILLR